MNRSQWCYVAFLGWLAILLAAMSSVRAAEPATVEAAARALDLRAFPVIDGASVSDMRTMGMLMYEAKSDAKTAFDFQRQQLKKRGWKEQPGGYQDAMNASGQFTKDGYIVMVSASNATGEPDKQGVVRVSLINYGNVETGKLPVPAGVKPFYAHGGETSYLTTAKVPETAKACRELLLAAGWEPYGTAGDEATSPMMYFKRNAIRLMAWVSTAPAQDNKTVIRYSTELMSADLPVPPDAPDPRYNDSDGTLRYDWPGEDPAPVATFYQEKLAKLGWKATTERPVVDDNRKTQFLVFRNPQSDMISLDMDHYTGIVRVKVQYYTAAKVAELDRLAKEEAERARQKMAKKNEKVRVELMLPAMAAKVEQEKPSRVKFELGTGGGPVAFKVLRQYLIPAGWSEEDGARTERNSGNTTFKKDEATIDVRYFDTGLTDAEITVVGSPQVIFEPKPVLDKTAAAPKAGKKTKLADIPGMPKLPAGVELPDLPEEVGDLLKNLEGEKTAGKKSKAANKKGAVPPGTVKVADITMPQDATSIEYNKTAKMIELTSASNVDELAKFFLSELAEKGWDEAQNPMVTDDTAIIKLSNGNASLTIFIHKRDEGTDATLVCKGVAWDAVPPSKIAAKKPARKRSQEPAADSPLADAPSHSRDDEPKPAAPRVRAQRIAAADQKQTGATLWAGGKVFKLNYGVAYESKQGDETATEVLLSVKPIAGDKLAALLNNGQDGGDAAGFDPHVKLRYDASGKLGYLFLYAEGLSVNKSNSSENVVKAEIAVADGRARGKAVMEKPDKLFDNEYRFDVAFDAKVANGSSAPVGDASAPTTDELGAEEHDGLPYPLITTNRSSSGSKYRKSATASVPAALKAVIDFYRRELTSRGWKENVAAAKVTADNAALVFAGPEGSVLVRLSKEGDGTNANLAVRYPAKAKSAGILPQPNRARLILGNASEREAVIVINGQQYKVPAGRGAKDPKDGVSLHVMPGKYTFVFKIPGQPDKTEELKVALDETWGSIILPTGGYFVDQVY
jgi:hypothetical protein